MTMHRVLYPKNDIDRVYLSREVEGTGLISCEECTWMDETTWDGVSGIQLDH